MSLILERYFSRLCKREFAIALMMSAVCLPSVSKTPLSAAAKSEIASATKSIQAEPSAFNYAERGRAYGRYNLYSLSAQDYTRAIELMPKEPGLYWRRAEALYQLKRYKEAIADCTRTIQLSKRGDDDYRTALAARARSYDESGKGKEAISDLRELVAFGDTLAAKDLKTLEKKWGAR